jgi:hypothetical protein
MRRLFWSATILLFLMPMPLLAQRGGHGFAGGRSSFGSGRSPGFAAHRGFSGPRSSGGMRSSFRGRTAFRGRSRFSQPSFPQNRFRGRFRSRAFLNNCFGIGCRRNFSFPWWGYYDPWLSNSWDSHYSFDEDYNNNLAIANEMNQQSLEQQRMLRQEEADHDQDIYNQRVPERPASGDGEKQTSPTVAPTVLVFRDQHREEIENYAIVGQSLWNLSGQRRQRIPLSSLDLIATERANDDRGIAFRVPATNEGQ